MRLYPRGDDGAKDAIAAIKTYQTLARDPKIMYLYIPAKLPASYVTTEISPIKSDVLENTGVAIFCDAELPAVGMEYIFLTMTRQADQPAPNWFSKLLAGIGRFVFKKKHR